MIQSFACKRTEQLFRDGLCDKRFRNFRVQAEIRLNILDAASSIYDLMNLKSNRFEALHGDRNGQFSISINMQWRVCFRWDAADRGPSDVEIVDYH